MAGLRNLVGGEVTSYLKLLESVREEALRRMVGKAKELGADAVIGVRFGSVAVGAGIAELFVYGTAVKLEKI